MSFFDVEEKVKEIESAFNECSDFAYRYFKRGEQIIALVFIKSIINEDLLSNGIFMPLQTYEGELSSEILKTQIIKCADMKEVEEEKVIDEMLNGKIIIFSNFSTDIIGVDLYKFPTRTPTEPPTSPVIQGPREGFVEDIKTNITLLRRRLKSPNLVIKSLEIGSESKTKVAITYIKGIANKKVIEKVTENLKNIGKNKSERGNQSQPHYPKI